MDTKMHEATKFLNSKGHRIYKSHNGNMFTNSSEGNKVYKPKAAFRKVRKVRKVATTASVPIKLRAKMTPENIGYTMHDLNHWTKGMFEHYGWMVLAMRRGHLEKVHAYVVSLKHLMAALNKKMRQVKESDRKDDLEILRHKVMILTTKAAKNF